MLMPKAAMHEQRHAAAGESQIGRAGQTMVMKSKAQAECVKEAPHGHFRRRIFGTHGAHGAAALLRRFPHE